MSSHVDAHPHGMRYVRTMPLVIRSKNTVSRLVVSSENATAFRRLCQHMRREPDTLLEEMIRLYIKTHVPDLEVIEVGHESD